MVHAGEEGEGGERREAVGHEDDREPEAQDDDPDVLDAVIGEGPLDVVLHGRVEDADEGGG